MICILFYKPGIIFISDYALVHVLPWSMRLSDGLYLLSFACDRSSFGVGWRGGLSSHKFYPPSDMVGSWPGLFIFTKSLVRHLGYLLSMDSYMCPFKKISWGVRSVLDGIFGCFMLWCCWRGIRSGQVNLREIYTWPGIEYQPLSSW